VLGQTTSSRARSILGVVLIAAGLLLLRRTGVPSRAKGGTAVVGGGAVLFAIGLGLNFLEQQRRALDAE
jgi:hypothetical protein